MTESRISRYFLCGTGEIFLIMIGILLALQVNEWNNERNRKIAEAVIVEQLKEDLKTSQIQLETKIEVPYSRIEQDKMSDYHEVFWKEK